MPQRHVEQYPTVFALRVCDPCAARHRLPRWRHRAPTTVDHTILTSRRTTMKLMFAPGSCALGIHLLLEEIGKPYETERVNLQEGAQYKPEFTSVNPKSKVPTLVRDDGSVLTEFPAIAFWLARTNPQANLLPDDPDAQARALEA